MYQGELSDALAQTIWNVRHAEFIPELEEMVFNFPLDLIRQSLEEGRSIRSIIKEGNIDYKQYIGKLRKYQTVGTAFMYCSPRSMIGDGVGVGKTAQICGLLNYLKIKEKLGRFCIAVESSAVGQTQIEVMKFTGFRTVILPSESEPMRKMIARVDWSTVDGIIIKHSTIKSDTFMGWLAKYIGPDGKLKLFNTFILDESSVIKNNDTKIYEYALNMCKLVDRVHFMNATSFESNIMDIYYQMDMMNPSMLQTESKFKSKYCVWERDYIWRTEGTGQNRKPTRKPIWNMTGYKNQAEFKDSLKLVYLGRSPKEVGIEGDNTYKVYTVQPTPAMTQAIAKGYRYPEVINCPSLIPGLKIGMNRKEVPKLNRLCEIIQNDCVGTNVVVYCFNVEAQSAIKKELEAIGRKCVILNGDGKAGTKKDEETLDKVIAFNNGEYDVFITNKQRSLNLYSADVLIMYSASATVGKLEQIRGRIDRHVDDRPKTFILLLYEGTGEFDLMSETAKKRGQDSRDLILDAETAIDRFIAAMEESD